MKISSGLIISRALLASQLSQFATSDAHQVADQSSNEAVFSLSEIEVDFHIENTTGGINPEVTDDMHSFVQQCVVRSFNEVHNPEEYHIEGAGFKSETLTPDSSALTNENSHTVDSYKHWISWTIRYFVFTGQCRMCMDWLQQEHDYEEWSSALCSCMHAGPFELVTTASECAITKKTENTEELKTKDDDFIDLIETLKEVAIVFYIHADSLTAEEESFVGAALMTAYNTIHDPTEYKAEHPVMESVEVEPEPEKGEDSLKGYQIWNMIWTYYNSQCLFCSPGDEDPPMKLGGAGLWTSTFCDMLRTSSYPSLQDATACSIYYIDIDDAAAASYNDDDTAISASKAIAVETKDDEFIETLKEVAIVFHVHANSLTAEEEAFVGAALLTAYNVIHNPAEYKAEHPVLESVEVEPEPEQNSNLRLEVYFPYQIWNMRWAYSSGQCRFCAPNDEDLFLMKKLVGSAGLWTSTFCDMLKTSPYPSLQDAINCSISYMDAADSMVLKNQLM